MRFAIVTPVLNGSRFIDETVLSVVTQAGPFTIRYHVQDGGSTDGTREKLAQWKVRLAGDFPKLCAGIEFTYASERDGGMYEAINRGFAACGRREVMSWINADDRYEPGAFATAAHVFERFADLDWLTGRCNLIDETGAALIQSPLIPFPRAAIAAGAFDGRLLANYIQQEGTFWRPWLWKTVGGVDARFRLAGDFDLWRRFARHTDLVVIDAILGCFRRRANQATENLSSYHAEIDALTPRKGNAHLDIAVRIRDGDLDYRKIVRPAMGDWICERAPSFVPPAPQNSDFQHRFKRELEKLQQRPIRFLLRRKYPRLWSHLKSYRPKRSCS